MNKYKYMSIIIFLLIILLKYYRIDAQYNVSIEIFSINFSDKDEFKKHFDNTTECYDGGTKGNVGGYVDENNDWYVFYGDNGAGEPDGADEPTIVVQGYCEADGTNSYAVFPYNYIVEAKFYCPSSPGHGNFYILPRYHTVQNKYEVVADVEWNNLVFNKMVGNSWSNIKITPLGFTLQTDHWYKMTVEVKWEYNGAQGKYMNHIVATISDLSNPSNTKSDEIWDDSLTPDNYNGLAFLGFDYNDKFKLYIDDILVTAVMEKIGEEPDESLSPSDLDVKYTYIYSDSENIFILIKMAGSITTSTDTTKYWVVQYDLDKDSRDTEYGWDYEYDSTISLSSGGKASLSGGDHILGGGIGYNYYIIQVDRDDLTSDSFFPLWIYSGRK